MAISQRLQQRMMQKLSPQQIQLMKLLQVPTATLEERLREEMEENPALELGEEKLTSSDDLKNEFDDNGDDLQESDNQLEGYENINVSDYVQEGDDDVADYKLRDNNYANQEENRVQPIKTETSFYEILQDQISGLKLEEADQKIAEQIIGSIDEDGYLRRATTSIADDLAFRQNVFVSTADIEAVIKKIQQFDPPGIGARNLQECLLLQLYRQQDEVGLSEENRKNIQIAIEALEEYFEAFTKKHYDKIQKGLQLTDEALKELIKQIIRLNPKPGGNLGSINKGDNYVIPDFFIFNNNGTLELTLNSKNAPDLRISEGYRDMLTEYDRGSKKDKRQKEAVLFIKQKIDSAKWFIDAIKQRQHTLLSTMQAILNYQYQFFLTGDETTMRPMILKNIADKIGLDISTVSRVANSKYVQTEFGIYRLKFFFSESISTESGEEVSTREVKKILSDLIESENKNNPHSDDALTELLQQKGYNIARRTVAKYREQLNISVARLRKEL